MKNQVCPKCGSKDTWRVTTTSTTTMTMGDDMTRELQRVEYLLCDECDHKWEDDQVEYEE